VATIQDEMGHIASDHSFYISANSKCNGIVTDALRKFLKPVHCSITPQSPESARTTGLYDRRSDEVSLDEVERRGI
jgi:hypothetical protein